jgi:FG-GAP-like repeat
MHAAWSDRGRRVLALVGVATFVSALTPAPGSALEAPGWFDLTVIPTARIPWDVAIADLTGDGAADLAVNSANEDLVVVLKGDGTGGFSEIGRHATGSTPDTVVAADLDGDGGLDLLTANQDGTVSALLGDGTGAFGAALTSSVGTSGHDVAVGDLDGDSIPDIVVATAFDPGVRVLLGDGTGSFGPSAVMPVGTRGTLSVALGLLDDDDVVDAAVTTVEVVDGRASVLATMVGNAAGGLTEAAATPLSSRSGGIVELGDFDGDGDLDAAVGPDFAGVDLYLNDGSGGFSGPSAHAELQAYGLAVADFDADGWLDVAATDAAADQILVLPGDGTGEIFDAVTVATGIHNPYGVAAGDIDGDGRPDLVAALAGDDAIAVLRNAGDPPGHAPAPTTPPEATPSPGATETEPPEITPPATETERPEITPPATETTVSRQEQTDGVASATLAFVLVGLIVATLALRVQARRMRP